MCDGSHPTACAPPPYRGNLLPNLTTNDMKTCRFHPERAPFCPILRVGDVVRFAGQDFTKLAGTVSLPAQLCLPPPALTGDRSTSQ